MFHPMKVSFYLKQEKSKSVNASRKCFDAIASMIEFAESNLLEHLGLVTWEFRNISNQRENAVAEVDAAHAMARETRGQQHLLSVPTVKGSSGSGMEQNLTWIGQSSHCIRQREYDVQVKYKSRRRRAPRGSNHEQGPRCEHYFLRSKGGKKWDLRSSISQNNGVLHNNTRCYNCQGMGHLCGRVPLVRGGGDPRMKDTNS